MAYLIYTYTDWQAGLISPLRRELAHVGEDLFWIGRRSANLNSASIRGVRSSGGLRHSPDFAANGPLPLLDNPHEFERQHLSDYIYQMTRYSAGYSRSAHSLSYFHEYRDHFHLTARKLKQLLLQKNISAVLFVNIPHTGDDYLLYRIAEDMGLRVTLLYTAPFPQRLFSTPSLEAFGRLNPAQSAHPAPVGDVEEILAQIANGVSSYMGGTKRRAPHSLRERLSALRTLLTLAPSLLLSRHRDQAMGELIRLHRGLGKWSRLRREIRRGHRARNFLTWLGTLSQDVSALPAKFVYVPLHFQPEMTTAPLGRQYCDQALAIEKLAACLPDDYAIVVKENPKQLEFHREKTFTERLRRIERVTVMHPTVDNMLLMERASVVAAITGTAGWEAIQHGKPALCFAQAWYHACPGLHNFVPGMDVQTVLDTPPAQNTTETFLRRLLAHSHSGIVYEYHLTAADAAFISANQNALPKLLADLLRGDQPTTFA